MDDYGYAEYIDYKDIMNENVIKAVKMRAIQCAKEKTGIDFPFENCEHYISHGDQKSTYDRPVRYWTAGVAYGFKGEYVGILGFDLHIRKQEVLCKIIMRAPKKKFVPKIVETWVVGHTNPVAEIQYVWSGEYE